VRTIKVTVRWAVILVSAVLGLAERIAFSVEQEKGSSVGAPTERRCFEYPLGPLDQIVVRGLNREGINETLTVAGDGSITLPLIGRTVVAGLRAEELQHRLREQLKAFINEPNVSVSLAVPQSRHISVIGAVNQPGVRVIQGCNTLIDAISQAGGLRQDAGNTIKITRPAAPKAANANALEPQSTTGTEFEVRDIRVSDLLEAHRPETNILVQPNDVISIPRAQMVYVVGAVQKAGGFVISERDNISVLQALSLAGGLASAPAPQHSRILHGSGSTNRTEIAVDVKGILNGKRPDMLLQPDDILFIPTNMSQKVGLRAVEAILQTATGLAIWR
jgi:polysaccharide export outer membrane protein